MMVLVEPTPGRPGRYDAACGAFHVKAVRTPLLSMARRLIDAGFDPETELRMQHRGNATTSMRVKIGDAAKLTVREDSRVSPRFEKYHANPFAED
jgi:Fe2+ transport system protein FeoA